MIHILSEAICKQEVTGSIPAGSTEKCNWRKDLTSEARRAH